MSRSLAVLTMAGTLLSACGSPAIDDALVGTWTEIEGAVRVRYTFGADGSLTFVVDFLEQSNDEIPISGTYSAANGVVNATVYDPFLAHRQRWTWSYYVNATQFSYPALRPIGSHNGVIGTWTGMRKIENLGSGPSAPDGETIDAEFHDDGSYTWTETPFYDKPATREVGTWQIEADGTISGTQMLGREPMTMLDGAALVRATGIFRRNSPGER